MKFQLALFLIFSLVLARAFFIHADRKRKSKAKTKSKTKAAEPITHPYKNDYGQEFVTLASYSYCSNEQMTKGTCCSNAVIKDYIVELAGQVAQDNYTFAVLVHKGKERVVITLTGTKENTQLLKEGWYSNSVVFKDPKYKIYTSAYFNTVYTQVREKLKPVLERLYKDYPKYQYIYTGHSLGGAMSTLFSLDAALDCAEGVKYINCDTNSPALINYASPRVGNYNLGAYLVAHVPVIFRIVRSGDPVASIPACAWVLGCSNPNGNKFDPKKKKEELQSLTDTKTFWHVPGMISYNADMTSFTDCGKEVSENHNDKNCVLSPSLSVDKHTVYLTKSVSGICQGASRYLFRRVLLMSTKKVLRMKKNRKVLRKKRRSKKF